MTDKECLEQLINKLNLKKIEVTEGKLSPNLYMNEYYINKQKNCIEVAIGSGIGNLGFIDSFIFDDNGNIINHGIWS